jgi:hypothetical protein
MNTNHFLSADAVANPMRGAVRFSMKRGTAIEWNIDNVVFSHTMKKFKNSAFIFRMTLYVIGI